MNSQSGGDDFNTQFFCLVEAGIVVVNDEDRADSALHDSAFEWNDAIAIGIEILYRESMARPHLIYGWIWFATLARSLEIQFA